MEQDFYWSSFLQGVAFNSTNSTNAYGLGNITSVYSIFDTGSSGILLSPKIFLNTVNKIFEMINTSNFIVKDGVVFS